MRAAVIQAGISVFAMLLFIGGASAQEHPRHDAADPKHWYDIACCALNDCAPIAAEMVAETPAGYVATIHPGTHPMWKEDRKTVLVLTYAYRSERVRSSKDGNWHVCFNSAGDPLCIYVTGGGF